MSFPVSYDVTTQRNRLDFLKLERPYSRKKPVFRSERIELNNDENSIA